MASVYVTIGFTSVPNKNLHPVDVFDGDTARTEVVTSSGVSAAGALTSTDRQIAQIYCTSALYVTAGTSPTATNTNGVYVPPSIPTYISLTNGQSVAVIDA